MNRLLIATALSSLLISGALLAHSGATGVVKERMQLMDAMGDAMKILVPMFRNKTPYNADTVKKQAAIIEASSGEHMTRLFPEGTLDEPSEALPEIWQDWEDFENRARWLEQIAQGLQGAADNYGDGWEVGPGARSGMMGGNQPGFGPGQRSGNQPGFGPGMMMGDFADEMMSVENLAQMPAAGVFQMLAQTCSGCHKSYREEDD